MMKTLLLSFLFVLPLLVSAQKTVVTVPTQYAPLEGLTDSRAKVVLDTLFPEAFDDECALTPAFFTAGAQGGYVFGTNGFGDLYKLQRLINDNDEPFMVNSVSIAFGEYDDSVADTYISAEIYTDLNADGSFGTFLGVSDSIRVGDLLIDESEVLFTNFIFPDPVLVEDQSFLVAVDFTRAYNDATPGYIGILSTPQDCGDGTNAFEIFPTESGGLAFNTIYANWTEFNSEMYLFATIETNTSSTRKPLADYRTSVAPNPTSDRVNITFQADRNGSYSASLTDINGRLLRNERTAARNGKINIEWETADLPAGLYLYHVDGPEGRQSGKLMVR